MSLFAEIKAFQSVKYLNVKRVARRGTGQGFRTNTEIPYTSSLTILR